MLRDSAERPGQKELRDGRDTFNKMMRARKKEQELGHTTAWYDKGWTWASADTSCEAPSAAWFSSSSLCWKQNDVSNKKELRDGRDTFNKMMRARKKEQELGHTTAWYDKWKRPFAVGRAEAAAGFDETPGV
jgi:hypothetical protein